MAARVHTSTWLLAGLLAVTVAEAQVVPPGTQAPPRPQTPGTTTTTTPPRPSGSGAATGMPLPTDYVIGPDDVLGVVFWRDTEMSGDVTVRPDGNITLPLIRDIKAAGLRPDELREQIQKAAARFIADPNVTVTVRQINSRNVFITGNVARPGNYPVSGQLSVLQLIALAGGLTEFADSKKISVARVENGKTTSHKFNYNDALRGKNLEQNIVLKPGDTVLVP